MGDKVDVLWLVHGSKVSDFLLSPTHWKGKSRLKYFLAFGFTREDEKAVADMLVDHAMGNLPGMVQPQPTGPNRVRFEGTVAAPDGRDMPIATVWEVAQTGEERTMRFLTMIPLTR